MRKKIFIYSSAALFIILAVFFTLRKVNFLDYQAPVPYERINEITFENFRGLEFFQKSLYGNEAFAYIFTSIEHEYDGDSLKLEAFFHPSRSYVYNKKAYSKDLLKHEMYHFKITELHARMAKKEILEMQQPTKEDIETSVEKIKEEEELFQRKYDDETFHSYVLGKQKKYEILIDSLLLLHKAYTKPNIYIK